MATTRTPSSRLFNVDCKLSYTLLDDTHFLFLVHALDGMDQEVIEESLRLTPAVDYELHADAVHGHRALRLKATAGPLTLRYRARVRLLRAAPDLRAKELAIEDLPHEVLADLMPTRYCESDRLGSAATRMFGSLEPGYARVQAVCDWIHDNIEYRIGSSDTTTTACDVFLQRSGVCRDFAHLGVAFCRALNIPARLAVGYARFDEPPPDFHAVFEAFLGGHWVLVRSDAHDRAARPGAHRPRPRCRRRGVRDAVRAGAHEVDSAGGGAGKGAAGAAVGVGRLVAPEEAKERLLLPCRRRWSQRADGPRCEHSELLAARAVRYRSATRRRSRRAVGATVRADTPWWAIQHLRVIERLEAREFRLRSSLPL